MINKLLRKYSFLGDKTAKPPYMGSKTLNIQNEYYRYFDTHPVGHVLNWANGKLTMVQKNHAEFIDSTGKKVDMYRHTNPLFLYQNKDIKEAWDKVYNKEIPELYVEPVILGNHVRHDDFVGSVLDSEYVDAHACHNRDLVQQYLQTFDLIAAEVAMHFPTRPAAKLTFLDASNRTGTCTHNHDTHNGLPPNKIDIQYYTKGVSNYTQRGVPGTVIWTDDHKLKTDVFDAERMALLILLMVEAFPSFTNTINRGSIGTWEDIKHAIINVYPRNSEEYNILNRVIHSDTNPMWNHDRHMHCYITDEVNYDMIM